jgi:hypothetical protein
VRALLCVLALVLSGPAFAQENVPKKKPAAKKQVEKKEPAETPKAHVKPTPEQIRKFNELQKKTQ